MFAPLHLKLTTQMGSLVAKLIGMATQTPKGWKTIAVGKRAARAPGYDSIAKSPEGRQKMRCAEKTFASAGAILYAISYLGDCAPVYYLWALEGRTRASVPLV